LAGRIVSYGGNFSFQLLPGVANGPGVRLNNECRKCELLQITWSHQIVQLGAVLTRRPDQINTTSRWRLTLARDVGTANPLYKVFQSINVPAPTIYDYIIFDPGQYFYDNVIFFNGLNAVFTYENFDTVNTYDYQLSLVIKLKEY